MICTSEGAYDKISKATKVFGQKVVTRHMRSTIVGSAKRIFSAHWCDGPGMGRDWGFAEKIGALHGTAIYSVEKSVCNSHGVELYQVCCDLHSDGARSGL